MAQWKSTTVNCPACCEDQSFKICNVIDVSENPELREKIFNRDLFRFECPECGEEIIVSYDCSYIDNDKKSVISLICTDEEVDSLSILHIEGYTLRVVRTINSFVEKIALMEDGTDDKVVELYKIMLEDQFEDERPGTEILGIYYSGKNLENNTINFYIITGNAQNTHASLSIDAYNAIEKQFSASKEKYINDFEIGRDWAIGVLQNGLEN